MKKLIALGIFLLVCLTGCSDISSEDSGPTLENGTVTQQTETTPVSKGTYQVGDEIISANSDYYFGGFVNNDTFIINVASYFDRGGSSVSYYYTLTKGRTIKLPQNERDNNIKLKVMDYNLDNDTISFEQMK
jgi:hypothetical protein